MLARWSGMSFFQKASMMVIPLTRRMQASTPATGMTAAHAGHEGDESPLMTYPKDNYCAWVHAHSPKGNHGVAHGAGPRRFYGWQAAAAAPHFALQSYRSMIPAARQLLAEATSRESFWPGTAVPLQTSVPMLLFLAATALRLPDPGLAPLKQTVLGHLGARDDPSCCQGWHRVPLPPKLYREGLAAG